jgi:hypothetical protein
VTAPVVAFTALKAVVIFVVFTDATMIVPCVTSATALVGTPGRVIELPINCIVLAFTRNRRLSAVERNVTVPDPGPLSNPVTCHPPASAARFATGVTPGSETDRPQLGVALPPKVLHFQRVGDPSRV